MLDALQLETMQHISRKLRQHCGIHYPPERLEELQKRLMPALTKLNLSENHVGLCSLLTMTWTSPVVDALVQCLTIPETYFFRDPALWDFLKNDFIPECSRQIMNGERKSVRIWSAACCTGEEPYSLGIILHQKMGELANSQFNVLATDINKHYIDAAKEGVYSEWSMRATEKHIKVSYFQPHENKFKLNQSVKDIVQFCQYNLAEGGHPLKQPHLKFDLILCRNVFIYFHQDQTAKAVMGLAEQLNPDGWLLLSPHDLVWCENLPGLERVIRPQMVLLRKRATEEIPRTSSPMPEFCSDQYKSIFATPSISETPKFNSGQYGAPVSELSQFSSGQFNAPHSESVPSIPNVVPPKPVIETAASVTPGELLAGLGKYAEAAEALTTEVASGNRSQEHLRMLIQCLTNSGAQEEALRWTDRAVSMFPLNASFYYIKGNLLDENGNPEQAVKALQQSVFLEPQFVMAHFSLFNVLRKQKRDAQAQIHMRNVVNILEGIKDKHDVLPEADGLTASQLLTVMKNYKEQ